MTYAALALAATLTLGAASPVAADELARQGNINLALQLGDMITTRVNTSHGILEVNPEARPFVRSNASAFGYAILSNVLERLIWHHAPKGILISDAVEVYAIGINASVAHRLGPWLATQQAEKR